MINWRIIAKIIGQLLFLEAAMMVLCYSINFYYHEDAGTAFLISIIATILGANILAFIGHRSTNSMNRRESFLVVSLTWVVFSIFGALPFILSGYLTNPTDAYFETMSGFSTTGASLIDDVESLPHALLFWRSMTQWIGGLGIVFFTIAVIPSLVGGSVKVFSAEATGPMRTKMHPRLSTTGRWIWGIYSTLTIICAACFYIEGMGGFDCVNYAMTVTATGGFATHNSSTGYFNSPVIDYTAVLFMFLCGTSFTLLYLAIFKHKVRDFFRNTEFRLYVSLIGLATLFIMFVIMRANHYIAEDAIRCSLFQVVSFITTTGIFNEDASQWPHVTWLVLCICMIVGGCSGSTAGGIKCIRAVMLFQVARNEFKRLLHPNAVLPVRVNGNTVSYSSQVTLLAFTVMYVALCFFTYFIMILQDIDTANSFTIALSCASNVGPSLSVNIGPAMSWNDLTDVTKWLLSLLMLMGRLEILSVVALFTPAFWKDR